MGGLAVALLRAGCDQAGDRIARMLAAAPHRGGDHRLVTLGECALGVQADDLADAGVAVADGLAVAYTGAIDDLDALRPLVANGRDLPAPADVLHAAIAKWGTDAPVRLRGTFAAAYSDGRSVWSFGDHLGLKPLFYRRDEAGVYVASEAKQVVAGAEIPFAPDLEVVERVFLRDTYDVLPACVRGVDRLGAAELLSADFGAHKTTRYWHPERLLESARYEAEELQERFDALMTQAARRALTGADVVSLSGGIDSPAVAAYAAQAHEGPERLKAMTFVYPRAPSVDERRYAELVAERLGLDIQCVEMTANPLDDLRDWVRLADGPITFMTAAGYAESYRRARDLGARNVLTGELAEFAMSFPEYLAQHLLVRGRLRALAPYLRGLGARTIARELVAPLIPAAVSAARVRADTIGVPAWVDGRTATRAAASQVDWIGNRWAGIQVAGTSGTGVSMTAEETCQQVCGVRNRRPWADIDLWEFFLSLPGEVKHPRGPDKTLVRRLLRGHLPDEILDRQDKTVFDEAILQTIDYDAFERLLANREYELPGVDYALLDERLARRDMNIIDFMWARDLASVHAFLSLF